MSHPSLIEGPSVGEVIWIGEMVGCAEFDGGLIDSGARRNLFRINSIKTVDVFQAIVRIRVNLFRLEAEVSRRLLEPQDEILRGNGFPRRDVAEDRREDFLLRLRHVGTFELFVNLAAGKFAAILRET